MVQLQPAEAKQPVPAGWPRGGLLLLTAGAKGTLLRFAGVESASHSPFRLCQDAAPALYKSAWHPEPFVGRAVARSRGVGVRAAVCVTSGHSGSSQLPLGQEGKLQAAVSISTPVRPRRAWGRTGRCTHVLLCRAVRPGRGCSGCACSGPTSLAHRVSSRGSAGAQGLVLAPADAAVRATNAAPIMIMWARTRISPSLSSLAMPAGRWLHAVWPGLDGIKRWCGVAPSPSAWGKGRGA